MAIASSPRSWVILVRNPHSCKMLCTVSAGYSVYVVTSDKIVKIPRWKMSSIEGRFNFDGLPNAKIFFVIITAMREIGD